jgi:hypothetical protein
MEMMKRTAFVSCKYAVDLARSVLFAACLVLPVSVWAEAYCALRDPVSAINSMYPDADAHRSIVRTIGPEVRDDIAMRLPFTLHFNELGKHTLYVVQRAGQPLGFIHARSEPGRWGLVELVWSLTPDLRVRDFRFQRCRAPSCASLGEPAFISQIAGRDLDGLLELLEPGGGALRAGGITVPEGAEELALAIVRSAAKTIAVTQSAWPDSVSLVQAWQVARKRFPVVVTLEPASHSYPAGAISELDKALAGGRSAVQRDTVSAYRVLGPGHVYLGTVIDASWATAGQGGRFFWAFSKGGHVLGVDPLAAWPSNEARSAFERLIDQPIPSTESCSGAAELVATELGLLSRSLGTE